MISSSKRNSTSFDVYTAYNISTSEIEGLKVSFGIVPTSATHKDMRMKIALEENFDNLQIRTQSGEINSLFEIEGAYRVYKFTAGQTFYFLANEGFSEGETINLIIVQ